MEKVSQKKKTVVTVTEQYSLAEGCPVTVTVSVVNGKRQVPMLVGEGPEKSRAHVVFPAFWDVIKDENIWSMHKRPKIIDENLTLESTEKAFREGNIVFLSGHSHMIFSLDQRPISRAYPFDYIGTIFKNEYLDLEKALEFLKSHPWVRNKQTLKIEEIPYYNNDSGDGEFINVCIYPDQVSYEKMYEAALFKDDLYPSTRLKETLGGVLWMNTKKDWLGIQGCLNDKGKEALEEAKKFYEK